MLLFDVIKLWVPQCTPRNTKVHLARWNGREEPHDEYLAGTFEEWQRWQSMDYFNRAYVLSLIQLPNTVTRWLYVGLYRPTRKVFHEATPENRSHYFYDLERLTAADEWRGRLYVQSPYKERNSWPTGERLEQELTVEELTREPDTMATFPGFNQVDITMAELDRIVRNSLESWRTALSSVKGVYLITDKEGALYVGKADGADGLWGRWATYALTGHGNNAALMKEFGLAAPPERKFDLRFSILEIAPRLPWTSTNARRTGKKCWAHASTATTETDVGVCAEFCVLTHAVAIDSGYPLTKGAGSIIDDQTTDLRNQGDLQRSTSDAARTIT